MCSPCRQDGRPFFLAFVRNFYIISSRRLARVQRASGLADFVKAAEAKPQRKGGNQAGEAYGEEWADQPCDGGEKGQEELRQIREGQEGPP